MDPLFFVNLQAAHYGMLQYLDRDVPFKRGAVEVMLCLDPIRPVTQKEVCQRTQHTFMAVSQAVPVLKARGLVKGRPCSEDRRAIDLTLTRSGVKAYETLRYWSVMVVSLFAGLMAFLDCAEEFTAAPSCDILPFLNQECHNGCEIYLPEHVSAFVWDRVYQHAGPYYPDDLEPAYGTIPDGVHRVVFSNNGRVVCTVDYPQLTFDESTLSFDTTRASPFEGIPASEAFFHVLPEKLDGACDECWYYTLFLQPQGN
ncbi:MAG: winged helix-turn-helix transcriptional regulator [Spirochaetales bacterium]|nr:winged helix-turn-helix transcriptional regulator [Leptospiraceae bacterium]MCP5481090.1 winged helix-turn-helix transcriptional regulator [Spirochaetales bacterium]